jgi:FkbM family methyltransferase
MTIARDLLRSIFRNARVRIPEGPNQGLQWSLATAGRGYGAGTFEPSRVQTIAALIRPGDCFWDIGAHKGYVTLIAARRVGEHGRVYAFEPAKANLWYLRSHLRWNGVENVTVVPAAASRVDDRSRFGGGSSLALQLGKGKEWVRVRSVRSLIDSGECEPPTFLKIDAEGAEAEILTGAGRYLERPDLALLVSMHSWDLYSACTAILKERGYRIIESGQIAASRATGGGRFTSPDGRGDPDVLAIGPERSIAEEELESFILLPEERSRNRAYTS